MQLGVGLSFSWDTFGIERMIEDKMVCLGFLGCNIDTDLPFKEQNFNLYVRSFICLFKQTKQWRYNYALEEGKYAYVEGLHRSFLLLKQFKYKIIIGLNKNKVTYKGVFIISIWLSDQCVRVWLGPDAWVWNGC